MVIARSTGVLNFCVGAYAMVAGLTYGDLTGNREYGVALGIIAGLAVAVVISVLTEAIVVKPIVRRERDEFAAVMAIVALLFVLEQLAGFIFGHQAVVSVRMLEGYRRFGGFIVDDQQILGVAVALVVFSAVAVWIQKGKYGTMLRATGDNIPAAKALGLPVQRIRYFAMAVAGFIAGTAGVIVAPLAGMTFESATSYTIVGFIAMVVGGLGTPWAALAGGISLAALQTVGSRYIGGASADYILFLVVICIFALRPEGLFSLRLRT